MAGTCLSFSIFIHSDIKSAAIASKSDFHENDPAIGPPILTIDPHVHATEQTCEVAAHLSLETGRKIGLGIFERGYPCLASFIVRVPDDQSCVRLMLSDLKQDPRTIKKDSDREVSRIDRGTEASILPPPFSI